MRSHPGSGSIDRSKGVLVKDKSKRDKTERLELFYSFLGHILRIKSVIHTKPNKI